ncbi:MAG TPA: hypothetical protein VHK03_09315 [Aestuariivirgaceae bacterium]|jgi:hypothetical protein|nr:hypothetical protein [Aestuariivirgaceae bacterium]
MSERRRNTLGIRIAARVTQQRRSSSTTPSIESTHLSEYVADMALELSQLTKAAELDFLSHLLEMVFVEAFTLTQKTRD